MLSVFVGVAIVALPLGIIAFGYLDILKTKITINSAIFVYSVDIYFNER